MNLAAIVPAFSITVASMAAAGWPRAADATVASMVVPRPEAPVAMPEWLGAQTEPRRLFRAAQHTSARTVQVCQWAAAKHEGPKIDPHATWVSNGSPPFDYSVWAALTSEEKNQFSLDEIRCLAEDGDWTVAQHQDAQRYAMDDDYAAALDRQWNDPVFIAEAKSAKQEREGNGGRAPEPTEITPKFSEDDLAIAFIAKHAKDLRYVAAWSKWFQWTGTLWKHENTLAAYDLARKVCREAAAQCNKPGVAKALGRSRTVSAVEQLARSDRAAVATFDQILTRTALSRSLPSFSIRFSLATRS